MLKVNSLQKNLGGRQVLSDVNFTVNKGDVFALIGPNGAGKTTTIKCIIGEFCPDGGTVEVFGEKFGPHHKERIAVMMEDRKVFKKLTGEDYARLWQMLYPGWNEKVFLNFISHYKLDLKQKVETYSIGMKTIFLLGLSIASSADLLILDEPTQHLDPEIRIELMRIINEYTSHGKSVLVSSHEIYELEEYATHFGIIKEGKIIYTDSIDGAKEKHRIFSKEENILDGEIIGIVNGEVLVKTDSDAGRYPNLKDIVVGYLRGKSEFLPFGDV